MITFMSPLGDSHAEGEFAVLTFTVDASVLSGDQLPITLTLIRQNIMDENFNYVDIKTVNGCITITN
jgi:hypothetical protein